MPGSDDPEFNEAVNAAVAKALADRDREAERNKPIKDANTLVERTAARVWEMFREDAEERRKAETGDKEPARGNGDGGGGFLSNLLG